MRKFPILNKRKSGNSTGATLLEMAIGLPVLLILLMGTIDLGMALNHYLSITRATYEGLRFGAGQYKNDVGCYGHECAVQATGEAAVNLSNISSRVQKILKSYGYNQQQLTINIKKEQQNVSTNEQRTYNVINATVEIPYHGIMPFFKLIPMRINISFTDLFNDAVGTPVPTQVATPP